MKTIKERPEPRFIKEKKPGCFGDGGRGASFFVSFVFRGRRSGRGLQLVTTAVKVRGPFDLKRQPQRHERNVDRVA